MEKVHVMNYLIDDADHEIPDWLHFMEEGENIKLDLGIRPDLVTCPSGSDSMLDLYLSL